MPISAFMYICMFLKDHEKFWNLQDLLSICLKRGDTPVRFAYRTASEGFMVAEKWAKLFCTSNFRNKVHVFLAFERCNKQKRGQLKLMSTKSIPIYVLCQVISKFFLMIVNHRKLL